tara:strand:+ start:506 stop:736 length:231 start_codon:yes stop_codon:yes gene_type:complete
MPYINLDDCVQVEVEATTYVDTAEAYFDIDVHDIDGLDDYIKDEVKAQLDDRHEVVDAKAVAVEILRMLADILQQG